MIAVSVSRFLFSSTCLVLWVGLVIQKHKLHPLLLKCSLRGGKTHCMGIPINVAAPPSCTAGRLWIWRVNLLPSCGLLGQTQEWMNVDTIKGKTFGAQKYWHTWEVFATVLTCCSLISTCERYNFKTWTFEVCCWETWTSGFLLF